MDCSPTTLLQWKIGPLGDEEASFTYTKKHGSYTDPIFQSLMFGRYRKCITYLEKTLGYGLVLWWYLGAKLRDTRWSYLGGLAQRSQQMEPDQFEQTLRR